MISSWKRGLLLTLIILAGIALRVYPGAGFKGVGFDEMIYARYVLALDAGGVAKYPELAEGYITAQRQIASAILPPTRFLYIFCGWVAHALCGFEPLRALKIVSCLFAILTLGVCALFARRLGGDATMFGVLALMACAPTQIHMAQHALIDGFFSFWALLSLWTLWESLQQPGHRGWLAAYGVAVALMVMTKENAAFAFAALVFILCLNRWMNFGKSTLELWLVTIFGPLLGLAVLVNLAGGIENFVTLYRLLIEKAYVLPYAIKYCDGPWYRYLVDLMLISPLILILAIGGLFRIRLEQKPLLYVALFIAGSYALMGNVKYSFNLRYANMWDMPLRVLAFAQLSACCEFFGRRKNLALTLLVLALCGFELQQYYYFFNKGNLYELVSEGLLRVVRIVK